MPIHKLKLVNKKNIANNVIQFAFEKPMDFNFVPGQYGGFTLINPAEVDPSGITRRFSILSTPTDNELNIAIRMQSSVYKRTLNNLKTGEEIKFAGPSGNFVLHQNEDIPAVLIAGGIGITPFYSMIKHTLQQNINRKIYLFYGNRTPEDAAFLDELESLSLTHSNFIFIPVMEQTNSPWQGEIGYITYTLLKKYLPNINDVIYYICGSPAMVTALQETIMEMGIDANAVKVEDFPGY